MTLIDNIKQWWRLWSVRLNAAGLAIMAWVWFDPTAILGIVNMMPAQLRPYFPQEAVAVVSGVMMALALIARLVKQPKVEDRRIADQLSGIQTDG